MNGGRDICLEIVYQGHIHSYPGIWRATHICQTALGPRSYGGSIGAKDYGVLYQNSTPERQGYPWCLYSTGLDITSIYPYNTHPRNYRNKTD